MKKITILTAVLLSFINLFAQDFIEVTSFNSLVQLPQGGTTEITWNSLGVNNIKIEYATSYNFDFENPNEWNTIVTSTPANTGTYQWSLPDKIISNARIRVSAVENSAISDINDINLSTYDAINNPKELKIVYPNGGEFLVAQEKFQNITFKSLNTSSEAVLEFSSDAGQTWSKIDDLYYNGNILSYVYPSLKSYNWLIPNINSTQCKVRIKDKADNTIIDESDGVFTIQPNASYIEVTSFNSLVQLPQGGTTEITWNSLGVNNIKIEYATSYNFDFENPNEWNTIVTSTPANTGTYQWSLPDKIISNARIRVSAVENSAISDINDINLSTYDAINNPKELKIVYPNGGEFLVAQEKFQNITFKSLNTSSEAVLEFSSDAGQTWSKIDDLYYNGNILSYVYPSLKSYNWLIPNINSTQCKVRIKDKADNTIIDESDGVFTIQPNASYIEVTSFNSLVQLPQGGTTEITWNSLGVNNIKIEYATSYNFDFENPNEWNTIVTSTPANTGTYQWSLPDKIISNARIRVSAVENSAISDINDINLSTYDAINNPKELKIVYPNGGEFLVAQEKFQNITFKSLNTSSEAVLEFSSDAGQTWSKIDDLYYNGNILSYVYPSLKSYNWLIPNINSTQCKVRIKDKADNTIIDESDGVFTINGATTTSSNNMLYKNDFVKLFPNPCQEMVNINSAENIEVYCICTLNGSLIKQAYVNSKQFSIQLDNLEKGMYLLHFRSKEKLIFKKIVKQ